MLRSPLCFVALLLADVPAAGQSANITVGDTQSPTTWVTGKDDVLFGRAGIRLPQEIGGFRLVKVGMYDARGFDGSASYERGDDRMTIFLYQPIDNAIGLQWAAAEASMQSRFRASGRVAEVQTERLPKGEIAISSHAAEAGSGPLTDLLAMGRTQAGWNVKLRLTTAESRAKAVDMARGFFGSLKLAEGDRLDAPPTAPFPDCKPLSRPKTPSMRSRLDQTDRMALTLVTVSLLGNVGTEKDSGKWCKAGTATMGEQDIRFFRSLENGSYRAPLGDNGAMLSLEPTIFSTRPSDWMLTAKRISDQFIIQLWSGPGDDADFAEAIRRFPETSQRVITSVSRD